MGSGLSDFLVDRRQRQFGIAEFRNVAAGKLAADHPVDGENDRIRIEFGSVLEFDALAQLDPPDGRVHAGPLRRQFRLGLSAVRIDDGQRFNHVLAEYLADIGDDGAAGLQIGRLLRQDDTDLLRRFLCDGRWRGSGHQNDSCNRMNASVHVTPPLIFHLGSSVLAVARDDPPHPVRPTFADLAAARRRSSRSVRAALLSPAASDRSAADEAGRVCVR